MKKNNSMKTLVINSSPKQYGNISEMLNAAIKGLPVNSEIDIVNVHDLNIKPCTGCMKCRKLNYCVLPQDDAHLTGEKIEQADTMIIGSPVYWANMPGTLKMLFDRNVFRFMDTSTPGRLPVKKMKTKRAYLMLSCSVPGIVDVFSGQSSSCRKAINTVLKSGGITLKKTFVLRGTAKGKKPTHRMLYRIHHRFQCEG
jgi:putative NADPH-quinone reductase